MTASTARPPAAMFSHFDIYRTAMERLEAEMTKMGRISESGHARDRFVEPEQSRPAFQASGSSAFVMRPSSTPRAP